MNKGFLLLFAVLLPVAAGVRSAEIRAQETRNDAQKSEMIVVKSGTRIPLVLVNGISTKNSHEGDRVYLQTSFPIAANNRIIIPQGSFVNGTITQMKRPGKIKGRGELYLRFDSIILPNGVQRDFRGTVSGLDGDQDSSIKKEGKIEGDSTKGDDAGKIIGPTVTGTEIGSIAGAATGNVGRGAGIGAGIGAATGLAAVLLTRGPDMRLARGTSLEMQLDRDLAFTREEVNFLGSVSPPMLPPPPAAAGGDQNRGGSWPMRSPLPRPF